MLTRELMGLFALGVLWLNAGLIFAVALRQMRSLARLRSQLRGASAQGELVRGRVGEAPEGVLALRSLHQTGRAMTKEPDRVLFTDGPQSFEVRGGVVEVDGEPVAIRETRPGEAEVWLDPARTDEALACGSPEEFDEAFTAGSKYKGYARQVELEVREGDEVWVLGRRDGNAMAPWDDRPLVVSMIDPVAWAGWAVRQVAAFLALSVLGLALVTGLALWPPHFGLVSTIGGALCFAYFLAVQPLATALRDRVRTPARRLEGALWHRPAASPTEARA